MRRGPRVEGKDPGASGVWLPPLPASRNDLDAVLVGLRESYGLELG